MTSTQHGSEHDVVSFLKGQHDEIKRLFAEVESSTGEQREKSFIELRRLLAVHETAEEQFVHPRARDAVPAGDAVVGARLEEENAAKKMLADLERIGVDDPDFPIQFAEFKGAILAHAEHEEHEEFPSLAAVVDPDESNRLARVVQTAEAIAPTRPHAGVESPMANMVAGPFASMLDRARDAFRKL